MSETSEFGAFGRYTELPADQMTPSTRGNWRTKRRNVLATKVRRIVTGQASGQTMQPMPGGGAR
jgi:hypothetical protein